MQPSRFNPALVTVLGGLVLLGAGCSGSSPVPTTPAELVGYWAYVGWLENGVEQDLATYFKCTAATHACLAGTTTYAEQAVEAVRNDDQWAYREVNGTSGIVYEESGETSVSGNVMSLTVTRRLGLDLPQSQQVTEQYAWEIVSDTLVLTRDVDATTTWVFKLVK